MDKTTPILLEILRPGMLKKGDPIFIDDGTQFIPTLVRGVLSPGTDKEEICFDKRNHNKYFITSLLLSGESWAKQCFKIQGY